MKKLSRFILLAVLVCLSLSAIVVGAKKKKKKLPPCTPGTAFRKCVACGDAKSQPFRDLNVLKNRDDAATNTHEVTVAEIRKKANDSGHFDPSQQVSLTAFVASLDKGGFEESCNCSRDDLRDIHINVVAKETEKNDKTKFVVVEITPRWQDKLGISKSDYDKMLADVKTQINHKWVKFEGWMLRDIAHLTESKTTAAVGTPVCTGKKGEPKPCIWRATAWEVHPVTKFTVVHAP